MTPGIVYVVPNRDSWTVIKLYQVAIGLLANLCVGVYWSEASTTAAEARDSQTATPHS